jgi:hypothetical protein
MALESASYISQLVATYPLGSDSKSQGDDHLRLIKNVLKTQFGSLGEAAVTTTAEEINILDGATVTTEELNYVDGVTSAIQDQIDSKEPTQTPATQVEMEEGTETAIRSMSPYRVLQAIEANLGETPTISKGASTGYFIEPVTGLTLQWGYDSSALSSSTNPSVTFPVAFETKCAAVFSMAVNDGTTDKWPLYLRTFNTSGCTFRCNSPVADGFMWLAIGY